MRTSRILVILSIFVSLIYSCKKVELQPLDSDKVVVEGYLIPYKKVSLSVTKEIAYSSNDTAAQPIEGLEIVLTNNTNSEVLKDNGLGKYESSTIIVSENEKYSINFDYKGKTIKAETNIPQKPIDYKASSTAIVIDPFVPGSGAPPSFPQPIQLTWSNADNRYYLVVVENIETNPKAIFDSTRYNLKRIFRNKPLQTNDYELSMRSFSYYGRHRVILFNLNTDYALLYNDNGNSSLNLTTPPSNIEGGLGIFTGINSDTVQVRVLQ